MEFESETFFFFLQFLPEIGTDRVRFLSDCAKFSVWKFAMDSAKCIKKRLSKIVEFISVSALILFIDQKVEVVSVQSFPLFEFNQLTKNRVGWKSVARHKCIIGDMLFLLIKWSNKDN